MVMIDTMLDELVLIHSKIPGSGRAQPLPLGLEWKTCLRKIRFLNRSEYWLTAKSISPDVEIYRGHEAYRFLLEIICGLHSPLLGETEVLGQFRDFCRKAEFPATAWGHFLQQLTEDLLSDAKRIRHEHLRNLGSQSYGSLVRRIFLKNNPSLAVLGSGHLVREMLPWLADQFHVRVFYRSPKPAEELQREYPQIEIVEIQSGQTAWSGPETGLIIAAPLSSEWIEDWVSAQSTSFVKTIDLRGESANDPVTVKGELIDLAAFFATLNHDRQRAEICVRAAGKEAGRLAERYRHQMQCRPFGWEDLCA